MTTTYAYDPLGRLTRLLTAKGSDLIARNLYTHDAVGNRLSNQDGRTTQSYSYDASYRLTEAVAATPGFSAEKQSGKQGKGIASATQNQRERYQYDQVGNRITSSTHRSYTHDPGNRLLSTDGTTYRHDANGSRTSRTDASGTTTYAWNAENQLIAVEMPDGTRARYAYDPFGRRIEKTVSNSGGHKVTRFVYDGEDLLFETDAEGRVGNRYLHGPGIDEPLALVAQKETTYYHADGLGSIVAMTDDQARSVQQYEYDSFGNQHDMKNRIKQPYGYTGREFDRETGLHYYRARYYDSAVGRFISKDPIGFAGGDVNLYGYVQNNPVRFVDPFGLEILVCNRKVNGFPFIGNHAYPWDTTTNSAEGMRGSSGSGANATEKGPAADSCNAVEGSKGKEKEIMDFMRDNQNNGIWYPGVNDCHNAVKDAVENSGLKYPGAPGGRFGAPQ